MAFRRAPTVVIGRNADSGFFRTLMDNVPTVIIVNDR